MTAKTQIAFAPRTHRMKDAAVVAFLVIVLGAFVAQLLKPSTARQAQDQSAAAVVQPAGYGS